MTRKALLGMSVACASRNGLDLMLRVGDKKACDIITSGSQNDSYRIRIRMMCRATDPDHRPRSTEPCESRSEPKVVRIENDVPIEHNSEVELDRSGI